MGSFIVTMHARNRFKERFRLHFKPEIFSDNRDSYMLSKLYSESVSIDFSMKQRPGEYNALCVRHGRKVHLNRRKDMIFVWSMNGDNTVLLTILKTPCRLGQTYFK